MRVIGAGYGRTGTYSMREALNILGFGPCYHMVDIMKHHKSSHPQLWMEGLQGRALPVTKILSSYNSVVDWPAAAFYKEVIQEYPDAKVILTLRDADSWWKSISNSIHLKEGPLSSCMGAFFLRVLDPATRRWFRMLNHIPTINMSAAEAKADFLRHNEDVKAHVPADKLLQFSVKEGWEPLCRFLEVPVPDVPFPYTNSTVEIQNSIKTLNMTGWKLMLITMFAAGAAVCAAWLLGGKGVAIAVAVIEISYLAACVVKARRMGVAKSKVA